MFRGSKFSGPADILQTEPAFAKYQPTKPRGMKILRRARSKLRYVGFITCVVAAVLIFQNELNRKSPIPAKPIVKRKDWVSRGSVKSIHEASESEEHLVSHVTSELEEFT